MEAGFRRVKGNLGIGKGRGRFDPNSTGVPKGKCGVKDHDTIQRGVYYGSYKGRDRMPIKRADYDLLVGRNLSDPGSCIIGEMKKGGVG